MLFRIHWLAAVTMLVKLKAEGNIHFQGGGKRGFDINHLSVTKVTLIPNFRFLTQLLKNFLFFLKNFLFFLQKKDIQAI